MVTESPDELRARVAELEVENAALRSSDRAAPRSADGAAGRRPRRSRAVIATVAILLGVLLSPIAVITGWAKWTLTDTERFVATYAPLAGSPQVQALVVDEAMTAVDNQVDIDALTKQLVDGLIALGTGPRATTALQTLQGSLADGLRSQIRDGLSEFVASDRFSATWTDALRIVHRQLVGTLSNDPDAVAQIGPGGTLGIPLAPIIEQVKSDLVARGITLADRIPQINRTVVLVQSDQLATIQLAYAVIVGVGSWLPWVVLALLIGGVAVANRRHRALVWAAAGFALAMLVLAAALAAGRVALVMSVPSSVLPGSVTGLLYDTATHAMRSTALSAAVLGVAVGVVGWWTGPFRTPSRLRRLYRDGVGSLRARAAERGVSTGKVGAWLYRRRQVLFALIAVIAGLVVVVNMPVTVALVGWTAFWSVLAVVVFTLVERPEIAAPAAEVAAAETADRVRAES